MHVCCSVSPVVLILAVLPLLDQLLLQLSGPQDGCISASLALIQTPSQALILLARNQAFGAWPILYGDMKQLDGRGT